MKKVFLSLLTLSIFSATTFISCKKDKKEEEPYKCTTCVKTPEAKAAHDASSKGIYKGVFIGSSGTIKFDIGNDANTITAVLVIDGKTINLTSTVTWNGGQAYIAPFTGTFNGQPATVNFSVQANGSSPTVTSANIPGHPNAVFTVVKETSNSLIEAFEGTYSSNKPESGTFNILVSRSLNVWGGVSRENGAQSSENINGTMDASGKIKDRSGRDIGTLSGDKISGSFQNSSNHTVTISGKRTL